MTDVLAAPVFVLGAAVSLTTSWVLVSRLERVGARLRASEALLGLLAALAADAPEISSAASAVAHHQHALGVGVVLGSNVFNLAALLGLGALVAGRVTPHRRVIAFEGVIALSIAVVCILTVVHVVAPALGLALVLVVLVPYVALSVADQAPHGGPGPWARMTRWLRSAVQEEEQELSDAIQPRRGGWRDAAIAAGALVVVVVASVGMERAASALGTSLSVPEIVTGGLVLAAVTSLPNAVAAIYLARRKRAAASLSTALNSNALNVLAGFLVPAVILGLGESSGSVTLVASWYLALTALALLLAFRRGGLGRLSGSVIIGGYLAFAVVLVTTA